MRFGTMFKNWVKSEESKEIKSERIPFVIEQKIKDMYEKFEDIRQNTPKVIYSNIWDDIFAIPLSERCFRYYIFKDTEYGNRCLEVGPNYILYYKLKDGCEKYDNFKSQKVFDKITKIRNNYKSMFFILISSCFDEVTIEVADDTNMSAEEIDLAIHEMMQYLNTKYKEVKNFQCRKLNELNDIDELTEYFSARVN